MHTQSENTAAAKAMEQSKEAFNSYRHEKGTARAQLLLDIGSALEKNREVLVALAAGESHLPDARLQGELSRTINQLKMFARLLREGSWVQAVIDTAIPDRAPAPRPDLRKLMRPLGPVVIFGASNFPFAFSTLGGDTASALAAGCPVVIKCHPGHPKTSTAVAKLAVAAAIQAGMPEHLIQHLDDCSIQAGIELVQHPITTAVGFTGSAKAGKALQKAINQRERPISLFAEMGSVNPVLLLPQVLEANPTDLAGKLAASTSMGVGQFCTNPGIIIVPKTAGHEVFIDTFTQKIRDTPPAPMLHEGILENFHNNLELVLSQAGVKLLAQEPSDDNSQARATLAAISADTFINNPALQQEVFGPFSLLVLTKDLAESTEVLKAFEGQLTTSVFANNNDWSDLSEQKSAALTSLMDVQESLAGRIIFNEVPTGVEVSAGMVHGGPFPATSNPQFTSVGAAAIYRWVRPVCYQGFPDMALPIELQNSNPLAIMRLVNDQWNNQPI